MTMVEFLEADRERLIRELSSAGTADKAENVITGEADRLLLLYNERCELDERREAAAMMLQTARMAAPLVNTIGETKIWEEVTEEGGKGQTKIPLLAKVLGLAGGICAISSFIMALFMTPDRLRVTDIILALLLLAAAPALIGLAGNLIGRSRAAEIGRSDISGRRRGGLDRNKTGYHVENRIDARRTYMAFRNMLIAVDQNLERIASTAAGETAEGGFRAEGLRSGEAGTNSTCITPDKAEIELFADLLEASLSQDGEYALEKLGDIRFYLHRRQVETILYDGSNRELFDFMPAAGKKTFRPALVKDGKVLKKGLASEGRA